MLLLIRIVLSIIASLALTCNAYGQAKIKKVVTEEDYHLWGTMYVDKTSDEGQWVSIGMRYDEHPDTLIVKSTNGKKEYKFVDSPSGTFGGEHWFATSKPDGSLLVLNTVSGKISTIPGVEAHSFSSRGDYLVTLEQDSDSKVLRLRDKKGAVVKSISNVSKYSQSPQGESWVYVVDKGELQSIELLKSNMTESPRHVATIADGFITQFEWQNNGDSVAFIHQSTSDERANQIYFFAVHPQNLYQLDLSTIKGFPDGMRISDALSSRLKISVDGSKVFFGIEPIVKPDLYNVDSLQIWNGNDKWIYPQRKIVNGWADLPDLAAWWPTNNRFLKITQDERSHIFFSGDERYAITYDPHEIGPQYKYNQNVNYYVTDLESGVSKLFLADYPTGYHAIGLSPDGKYLAYFKGNSCWVYDFKLDLHSNVAQNTGVFEEGGHGEPPQSYRIAGWSSDGKFLFLHDKNDVWRVALNTSKSHRITRGTEEDCVYRVLNTRPDKGAMTFVRKSDMIIDTSASIVLLATGDTTTAFYTLETNGTLTKFEEGEMGIKSFLQAKRSNTYVYSTQRFDRPADLRVYDGRKVKAIYQSNPFYSNYLPVTAKVIDYKNSKGVALKAILNYPADYDPAKKYPMIVNIYEKQLNFLYKYSNPSKYNMTGDNSSNLAAQGYFVLRPDIVFERGDPGVSAADCTISATQAVIDMGLVDQARIGLTGRSFGGYETNFIITQTNLFAAAVSGCGIADLSNYYLSIGWNTGHPEIFRLENQQWRIGKSLFEDKIGYDRNSPVVHAAKVNSPLLLWTGEKDTQVHPFQSISYYLALRRLDKKQILLIYPGEGHSLLIPRFQWDLTRRMEDWWGHYLKGEHKQWILDGVQ